MTDKSFAHHVKSLRTKRAWSQEFLADRSGLTVVAVAKIERGEFEIRLSTLIALADAFHTTLSNLLQGII